MLTFMGFTIPSLARRGNAGMGRLFRKSRYKKGGYLVCLTLNTARQNG